jgi:selenocysteine lyase/cysteine desulfurase
MPKLDEAKERFARLIGARPHEVTVSHSISSALTTIASCFLYADRNAVVCADLDFPTIAYQWLARQREGVEVRFARSRDRIIVPMEAYADVVNEKVELVATSHVLYATGAVQPIREIAELTHGRGGRIVVDGYHSVGVLPVDVKALDVDFYVGGVLKWLLGGPGLTFIYVREDLLDRVTPATTGWFASANQFAFDTLHFEPAATADRFEMGTPSMPTAYTGVAGMDMILEAEPERIYQRIRALTDRIVRRAQVSGFEIVSPEHGAARGGVVTLGLERPDEMVSELKRRGFTVDYRPGLLRISPHFFNTEDDVDGLMDEIEAVRSGA